MNDELAAAWTTLRTTPLGSLDNDTDLERVEKAILTVLAALERALPLLPLVDVIERLETIGPGWEISIEVGRYATALVEIPVTAFGPDGCECRIESADADTWSAAVAALAQAVESEAKL